MASRGVNKVILIGNVGQDPEVRYFSDGSAIANVSLATSEVWKDKNTGEQQEKSEWHRVVFRGKLAEIVQQYVHKGDKLYVEGKLQTRKWQGSDGADRYSTEVVVDGFSGQMQMLGGRGTASEAVGQGSRTEGSSQSEKGAVSQGKTGSADGFEPDSDIPF